MSYSPGLSETGPSMVSIFTMGWGTAGLERATSGAEPTSVAWESAERAVYLPLLVPVTCVVRRVWWVNGASVNASYSVDLGIYADAAALPSARLISAGSTAQGTANQVQFVDVTDTTLAPGRYWLAIACSSTSATFFRTSVPLSTTTDAALRLQQATARPLPATATPVASDNNHLWLCGFATTASP